MNSKVMIVTLVATLATVSSCSSSHNQPAAPAAPRAAAPVQAAQGPAWKFMFKSTCTDEIDATQCVGLYGFSVAADGSYSVGPAPAGQLLNGKITPEELSPLADAVSQSSALPAADSNMAETCSESDEIKTTDTLTLTHLSHSAVIAHQTGNQFCYKGTNVAASKALYTVMLGLATKYYATPFPDACTDAAAQVTGMYAALQGCKVDTDCAYFTDTYDLIAPLALEFVTTDNCSVVKPLIVGNSAAVTAAASNLQQALATVQTTCGQRMQRMDCTQQTGFQSTSGAPVCGADKMCHINSGVSSL